MNVASERVAYGVAFLDATHPTWVDTLLAHDVLSAQQPMRMIVIAVLGGRQVALRKLEAHCPKQLTKGGLLREYGLQAVRVCGHPLEAPLRELDAEWRRQVVARM